MIEQLWGCGDLNRLFSGGAERTTTPWPRGDKTKQGRTWDPSAVEELLRSPVELVDIDPREVRCSQPWIVRHHVDYYRSGWWELSGRPSADLFAEHNRFPVVVRSRNGHLLVLSGHHRTAAALIEGRPVRARVVALGPSHLVTPTLRVDASTPGIAAADAASTISRGQQASVQSCEEASIALRLAGVGADEIETAVRMARKRGGCR